MKRMPIFSPALLSLAGRTIPLNAMDMFLGAGSYRKQRKPSKKYPFSSTRQNARYARQIAAGQIKMERV